jgi:hypothetical protein
MIENKFTKFEIAEYVCGWLIENIKEDGSVSHWYNIEDIESALANAKCMLRDGQDGIIESNKGKVRERLLHDD